MAKIPIVSARKVVNALRRLGFVVVRQSGSHIQMWSEGRQVMVTVPNHDELTRGTLLSIIKQARLTREEFVREL